MKRRMAVVLGFTMILMLFGCGKGTGLEGSGASGASGQETVSLTEPGSTQGTSAAAEPGSSQGTEATAETGTLQETASTAESGTMPESASPAETVAAPTTAAPAPAPAAKEEKSGLNPFSVFEMFDAGMSGNGYAYEADGYYESGAIVEAFPGGYYEPGYPQPDWNTEEYAYTPENPWRSVLSSPFSTFAADVDTASYANLRRMVLAGREVPADAVRIEEMVNYFRYDYPDAKEGEPFSATFRIAPCPWNEETELLMVGLQAKEIPQEERPASNLVFLIDVSGSMSDDDKLPLVQRAFRLLAEELGAEDRVSLITYAYEDTVVLEGVYGTEKAVICDAVENLSAAGGTNGSAGLIKAYELAEKYFVEGGNNRVILATDGDLNIGMTDEGSLVRLIAEKAKSGVFLSVLGFGQGNLSDARMEAMADNGNGNYSYIDSIGEARKVLISEAGSTLFTVAKDVKLQMEFNPERVKGYRLIGYENRTMAAESFADDTKDGGEVGSGHQITVLYEIASADSEFEIPAAESKYTTPASAGEGELSGEWGTLHLRYKEPEEEESSLMDWVIDDTAVYEEMDENMSWAAGVAQAGMVLKESEYLGTTELSDVKKRLKSLAGEDEFREEFLYLLGRMAEYGAE